MRRLAVLLLIVPAICVSATEVTTDITHTKVTEREKSVASMFGLDIEEWERYKLLKEGPAGFKNPNMHPVFMLALYAGNKEEQEKYANIKARLDFEYISRIRQLQNTYIKTFDSKYPNAKVVDLDGMYIPGNSAGKTKANTYSPLPNDRVVLFIKPDCAQCLIAYKKLLTWTKHIKIDIHFDTDNESIIRAWANKHKIPRNLVKSKIITLNKPGTLLADWGITQFPTLLKKSVSDADYQEVSL